jgi:hypothetical protein
MITDTLVFIITHGYCRQPLIAITTQEKDESKSRFKVRLGKNLDNSFHVYLVTLIFKKYLESLTEFKLVVDTNLSTFKLDHPNDIYINGEKFSLVISFQYSHCQIKTVIRNPIYLEVSQDLDSIKFIRAQTSSLM